MADDLSTLAVISRQEAMAQGLTIYFTGKPCSKGHVAQRRVNKATCLDCENERRASRAESLRPYFREYYAANRERVRAHQKTARDARLDYYRGLQRQASARHRRNNPEMARANARLATAQRRSRDQPHVLANRAEFIRVILACPPNMEIDHIVPLGKRAKTAEGYPICGLHVPWNLQYLKPADNLKKHTRMRPQDQALCEAPSEPANVV